jgi:probable DNA metabolism protein
LYRSLSELFSLLEGGGGLQREMFAIGEEFSFDEKEFLGRQYEEQDIEFIMCYFSDGFDGSLLVGSARRLFELSFNAFDLFLHAWLSELPVEKETIRFGRRVLSAAEGAAVGEQKSLAERAAADRGDSDTLAVLAAAYKVQLEVDRMRGLLRFFPCDGVYAARCAPDHFVLPALERHFSARFGETSWAIIDEKRELCLSRMPPEPAKLVREGAKAQGAGGDGWEELWRHYHSTINNEERKNPGLQRQFMPKRYWKYLPEM